MQKIDIQYSLNLSNQIHEDVDVFLLAGFLHVWDILLQVRYISNDNLRFNGLKQCFGRFSKVRTLNKFLHVIRSGILTLVVVTILQGQKII